MVNDPSGRISDLWAALSEFEQLIRITDATVESIATLNTLTPAELTLLSEVRTLSATLSASADQFRRRVQTFEVELTQRSRVGSEELLEIDSEIADGIAQLEEYWRILAMLALELLKKVLRIRLAQWLKLIRILTRTIQKIRLCASQFLPVPGLDQSIDQLESHLAEFQQRFQAIRTRVAQIELPLDPQDALAEVKQIYRAIGTEIMTVQTYVERVQRIYRDFLS